MASSITFSRFSLLWRSTASLLVGVICAAVFIYSAYQIYRSVAWEPPKAMGKQGESPVGAVQRILQADIFNETTREGPVTEANLGSMELRGTFAGSGSAPSYAIIAEQGQEEKNYRIGDRLPNGMVITGIYADRILVGQAGTHYVVYLRPPQ